VRCRRPGPGILIAAAGALLAACRRAPERPAAIEAARSPFAATRGVTRAAGAGIQPLRPMTGDVEVLHGDPEKPGDPFVMRINELPGTRIPVHSHPVDENITVVQGSWWFALGETWDRRALKELRPGDYAFAPKGSSMFGWCPEGAVVQVHGVGPFTIHWHHGLKSFDDADAAATFAFRRGDRVSTPRGDGVVREGYASGAIVQYEVEAEGGRRFLADATDVRGR